ncbi:MAG: hypothetical protein IJY09_08100 [Lachnospiraceae bacterium]|nr:hypothetical protein [Lachnospiraceae bacterium]
MRKGKKLAALLMSGVMALSMAGCGSKEEEAASKEPVTLTVFSQLANYSGEMTGWSAKILKDKFNVVLNIVQDTEGVYDTRMQEGDLGDIVIWGSDGDKYQKAASTGMLYDWEKGDLLKTYGPYIADNMQIALDKNRGIVDGNVLYGFGHNVASDTSNHEAFFYTWDIRWDLYKQLGYPEVKDLNDYVELMADMKEICPTDANGNETYAVSVWPDWDGSMVMYVKAMATAYYGYDELGLGLYNADTGEYYDCLEEGGPYLEMLKFFNTLYQKDLLDPNSMTQTYDKMIEKVKAGGTFFSIFNYSGSDAFNTDENMAAGKYMATMTPTAATPIAYGMNAAGGNRIWSIGAKTQYPDLCMQIINWLCTPEGRLTADYGPKGLCWDYDANGKTYFTEFGLQCHNDRETLMPEEWGSGTFNDGAWQMNNTTWSANATNPESGEKYNCDEWASMQGEAACEMEADWRNHTGVNNSEEYLEKRDYKVAVGTTYKEGTKSDDLQVVWNQVTEAIVQYSWKAIYAADDATFDSLVDEMRKLTAEYGYDQCVEWAENEAKIRNELETPLRGK